MLLMRLIACQAMRGSATDGLAYAATGVMQQHAVEMKQLPQAISLTYRSQ